MPILFILYYRIFYQSLTIIINVCLVHRRLSCFNYSRRQSCRRSHLHYSCQVLGCLTQLYILLLLYLFFLKLLLRHTYVWACWAASETVYRVSHAGSMNLGLKFKLFTEICNQFFPGTLQKVHHFDGLFDPCHLCVAVASNCSNLCKPIKAILKFVKRGWLP